MTTPRIAAVVVVCCVLAGCNSVARERDGGSVRLQLPADVGPVRSGLPAPKQSAPITVGAGTVVCLDQPGTARVLQVSGEEASDNFAVQGFALRPNPSLRGENQLGEIRGTLADAGFRSGADEVDAVCDGSGAGYELGVQLARTGPGPATSRAFLVRWVSDTSSGTLRIPLAVVLCDATTAFPARCDTEPLLS